MAKDDKQKYEIHIDGVHYRAEQNSMTGAQLKALAGKPQEYQLFLEGHGHDADRQIGDTEAIELKNGMHFYSVPPATFG